MGKFKVYELQEVGQVIRDTIDFEKSSFQHRAVVKRHVGEEFD